MYQYMFCVKTPRTGIRAVDVMVHRQQLLLSAGLCLLLICLDRLQARPHTPTYPRYLQSRDDTLLRSVNQRLLHQGSAGPAAVTDPSGTFGAAPADSADCSAVCKSALSMSEIDAGVKGQQACAVYREAAWQPGIRNTDEFRRYASYGEGCYSATWWLQ
jgi:hypothetical protein